MLEEKSAPQQPAPQKTTAAKSTETVKKVRGMVKAMYRGAAEAKANGKLVAYGMVGSQYDEIVRAMDIVPIWTENYAGLCAAKRDAERFIINAENEGYSNVICGYVRAGLGFDAMRRYLGQMPPNSPDGGMAMPDMLLGSSFTCDPRYKWYQATGRYMNVPTYCYDVVTPPVTADLNKVAAYYVRYQHEQLKGLVGFLEQQTGRKLDTDRLWETIRLGDETWRTWYEVDQLRRAVPGPMPSEDHYNAMVPGMYYSGTPEALAFYQDLKEEVKTRVENKVGVIPDEKHRLLFGGGLPPWHTMWIFNYFESLRAVFVIENAYRGFDPVEVPGNIRDPVEYIAWRAFLRLTQRFEQARSRSGNPTVERILDLIQDYAIDGVLFHATRSCRATTIGQRHWKNLLQRYVSTPSLQLTSDIVDVRDYSEAQWKAEINAFVESVGAHKSASGATAQK